jgi:hypothetical protein
MSTVADKLAKKSSHKTSAKQVRLRLVYVDFWSAVKLSFLAAVALAIVTVVSFFLVYLIVQTTGLIGKVDEFFQSFSDGGVSITAFIGLPQVMAFAAIVAILNLVVVTVLGAVIAGIYNLAVKVTGGLLVGFTSNYACLNGRRREPAPVRRPHGVRPPRSFRAGCRSPTSRPGRARRRSPAEEWLAAFRSRRDEQRRSRSSRGPPAPRRK